MDNHHRHIGVGCAVFLIAAVIFIFVVIRFLFSGYHHTVPAPHIIYTPSTAVVDRSDIYKWRSITATSVASLPKSR